MKTSTFDGPDGVQGWESDKKVFWGKVWAPSCEKSGLFQKVGLALGLGLGLVFQGVKIIGSAEALPILCVRCAR